MARLIYVGNSDFAVKPLEDLAQSNHELALVVTQKDRARSRGKVSPSPVKLAAESLGLPVHQSDDINSSGSIASLQEAEADFMIVVSFGQFIGDELLGLFEDRIINVHASILPKYRGASPIQASLFNGDSVTGVSIMLIDQGMDTGDVLKICPLEISKDHNYLSLSDDLSELGGKCLIETLDDFGYYYKNREEQDDSQASHAGFISKEMGHINFDEPAEDIVNKHKAFYAWPKLYFIYQGDNVKVHDFYVEDRHEGFENGQIIMAIDKGIFVNCKDACLVFTEVQFPSKRKIKVEDYLKGNQIEKIKLA